LLTTEALGARAPRMKLSAPRVHGTGTLTPPRAGPVPSRKPEPTSLVQAVRDSLDGGKDG